MAEQIGVEAVFGLSGFSKGLSSYEKGLDKAEGSTGSFVAKTEKSFGGLGGAIGKVGSILATGLAVGAAAAGAAVVGVGVKGIEAFKNFQASMNEVFTLLPGITQESMGQMSDQVKKFSTDFGVLPEEVVPALYQALSAGVPQDNVFAFLEVANKAAVGGASDLTTAVNGISSVVNAYGADVLSAGQASDIMFTTVRLGKTNFQELSDSMFNVGPTAAALGVGFDQVSAALAAMTLQGTPTSVATTQLRSLMVELSKDGSKAAATFEHMAGKSFKDFMSAGGDMSQALGVMEKAAAANGVRLSDMFGSVEAGNAALALTGKGAETFNADLAAMKDASGATDAAFAQMNTGIQDTLDDLKVAWAVALLDIGEKLAPFVQTLADLAGQALPYLTAALGKVLDVIGVVADGFVGLVSAFTDYYAAVTDAGLGTIETQEVIGLFPDAIQPAAKAVDKIIGAFFNYQAAVEDAGYGTIESQESIGLFPEALQPAAKAVDQFIGNLLNYNEAVLDAGYGTIESKEAISLFPAALQPVALAFDEVAAAITEFGSGALTEIKTFVTGGDTEFTNLKAILSTVGSAVSTLFSSLVTYVSSNLPAWKAQLVEWGKAAWEWTVDAATQVVAKLGEWWTAIQTFVTSHAPIWVNVLKEWARAAWNWIVDAAGEVVNKLGEWWTALQTYVTSHVSIWINVLKEWAIAAWQWIVDAAGQVAGKLDEWFAAIQKWLDDNGPVFKKKLDEWSFVLYGWISSDETKTGTQKALDDWKEKSVFAQLGTFNTELNDQMLDAQATLVGWITDAIPDTVASVTDWIISLFDATDPSSPTVAPAVSTAQDRLNKALDKMWTVLGEEAAKAGAKIIKAALEAMGLGFLTGEPELTTKAKETNDKALASFDVKPWYQRGIELITGTKEGAASEKSPLDAVFEAIADAILAFFDVAAWNQRGADLLSNLKSGWDSLKGAMLASVATLAGDMVKKFTDIDWAGAGKSIIDGILLGLKSNAGTVLDYLTSLAHDALNSFLAAIGAKSPSKEFAKAGEYIIEGLIVGLEQTAPTLYRAIDRISQRLLSSISQGKQDAVSGFSSLASSFLSAANPFAEAHAKHGGASLSLSQVTGDYNRIKQTYDLLKSQADLIKLVRESGGDVGSILGHIKLGRDADPGMILRGINQVTEQLTTQLEESIQVASRGYDQMVNDLRSKRRSVEEIESDFQTQHLTGLDVFEQRIKDIDGRIVTAESDLLTHGGEGRAAVLTSLHKFRQESVLSMQEYLRQWRQLNITLGTIQSSVYDRTQKSIDAFRKAQIDPLIEQFQNAQGPQSRDLLQQMLNDRVAVINEYAASAGDLATIEKRVTDLMDSANFGTGARRGIEQSLEALYDINREIGSRTGILSSLTNYVGRAEQAFDLFNQIASDDPLLGKVKSQLVEPLLAQLFVLDQTAQQRADTYYSYSKAVSQLLAVEQKAKAVGDIQERLDLIEKIKTLADDLGDKNVFARVFSGMDLTKTLAPQDLATVIARYTDESIRLANNQLREALRVPIDVEGQLAALRKGRETFEQIQDDFVREPFSQLRHFQDMLTFYDDLIAKGEQEAIEKNSQGFVNYVTTLTTNRKIVVDQTRDFLRQMNDVKRVLSGISASVDESGTSAVEAFKAKYIDPLVAFMDQFGSVGTRQQLITQISNQVGALNTFITRINQLATIQKQMAEQPSPMEQALSQFYNVTTTDTQRQAIIRYMQQIKELGDVEKSVAGITGDLANRFREDIFGTLSGYVSNFNLSESSRQSALTSLKSYVGQLKLLREVVKDTSAGASINPLVGRFQTDVMDKLLNQFYDLNTSEAQRLNIIQQYRMEQEKILALQTKQQQLDYLNQQLDLMNQVRSLDEGEFGDLINPDQIFSGITFGMNATLDDMLKLTSRVIDAMISTVKADLGIHSPSKVFAEIGEYMMQGLGAGIWNARQVPSMAMAGAVQQVPYSMTNNRSINVNMGGVAINNGMDDIMFEARVRQVVEGLL